MLLKENRLSGKEVRRVLRRGRVFWGSFLSLRLEKIREADHKNFQIKPGFSVIIPMSLSKKSSKRNFLKRKIREALRKRIHGKKEGFKGIVMALPGALQKDYKQIEEEIDKILAKAKIFKS